MSKIKLTIPAQEVTLGKQVCFTAPCDCSDVTCLVINDVEYDIVDAMGKSVAGTGTTWSNGALLSVLLDTTNARAFLLNASNEHTHNNFYSSTMSRNANAVLAAPNGSNGAAVFRMLTLADLPDTFYSSSVARPANKFLATPNGDKGAGSFRSILAADLPTVTMAKGGTGAENGATGLKNLFAAGNTILSSYQYGTSLPAAGNKGRIFFKKVSG